MNQTWTTNILPFIKKRWKLLTFVGIPLLLIVISIIIPNHFDETTDVIETVKQDTITKTVLATGTVTSTVDLNLSFNGSGTVSTINVAVGDVVKKGQVLASLNAKSELGSLLQAQGALKYAQAQLQRTLEGATSEEVALAQVALDTAKKDLDNAEQTQNTLVKNAYRALLNSTPEAVTSGASSANVPTISGIYSGDVEGSYIISPYSSGSGGYFSLSGLEGGTGEISTTKATPLGSKGLFIQFPSGYSASGNVFTVTLPNTKAATYVTNLNAYNSALETKASALSSAQSLVSQREAELNLKRAAARPADIAAKEADVLAAQGRVASAEALYEDKIVRAPADGTITKIDIELGESPTPKEAVIVLQDIADLYLEANVNESDVSLLELGQKVTFTTDAFGPEQSFVGTLSHIDPAPTTNGSVVNYKIKARIDEGADMIKTGMTANLSVLIAQKVGVRILPMRFVETKDGMTGVNYIPTMKRRKTEFKNVTLGMKGDGDLVEIVTGLNAGDKILLPVLK